MTDALRLIAQIALEHPIPVAVGLIGLTVYFWHLNAATQSDDAPEQPVASRELVVWDAMQRAKAQGVVHVNFKTGRKVG